MKKIVFFTFTIMALLYGACDSFNDPEISEVNGCTLTIVNNVGVPLSYYCAKFYYTNQNTDFVFDSNFTSDSRVGNFYILEPTNSFLKAFYSSKKMIVLAEISIQDRNSLKNIDASGTSLEDIQSVSEKYSLYRPIS